MVGIGTLLFLLSAWYALSWLFRRDLPKTRLFLWIATFAGIASVLALEAGWTVTEVGRQPWIVSQQFRVTQAATTNGGVWVTFLVIVAIYLGLAVTTILVLRKMSRRWQAERRCRRVGGAVRPARARGRYQPHRDGRRRRPGAGHMTDAVAVVLFVAITAYAVFGGADFGAGFWDLVAGGAEKGERPRAIVSHAIAPVWEANHVWLIFALVVLWTAFSPAFSAIMITLFVPLTLAAFGIVLRGSSFVFRNNVLRVRDRRNFGAAFASSSVLVPYCFGAVAGAIASGRVPAGGKADDPWSSWVNPTSILGGVLAVTVCAFLAAVYLSFDAHRLGDTMMSEYFRTRAFITAIVTGLVAFAGIFVLRADARYVFDGLTSRALPLVIISAICGLASLALLRREVHRYARLVAAGAVATVVGAWGVAQWNYMLPQTLTVDQAAAPTGTLGSGARRVRHRGRARHTVADRALHPRPAQPARRRRRAAAGGMRQSPGRPTRPPR